jgi:SAM-dependent methyltransferase
MTDVRTPPPHPCRSCGSGRLSPILDLGSTPLANALLTPEMLEQPEETFPLVLAFCDDCALAQITESVPPEKLFSEYLYFSSFSDTMLAHAAALAVRLARERSLSESSLVVEIASNDGYLLQYYKRVGIRVLGIEPAANIARVAEAERGIPTICAFFDRDLGRRLAAEGRKADVLHANNVLAHVPDLNGFVQGMAAVLKPGGVIVVEAPYLGDLVARLEFDTIYHEHMFYFSLTALDRLFARHGLAIIDVEHIAIHGGSLRVFATHREGAPPRSNAVRVMLEKESAQGLASRESYRDFAARVKRLEGSLTKLLADLKAGGKRIAAYGASAKGSTLLNTWGIGGQVLDYVVDRSTHKQGRLTPGTHLRILPPEELLRSMPDYVLLLTWNFEAEILAQQAEYMRRGGRFIIPLPDVRIV